MTVIPSYADTSQCPLDPRQNQALDYKQKLTNLNSTALGNTYRGWDGYMIHARPIAYDLFGLKGSIISEPNFVVAGLPGR